MSKLLQQVMLDYVSEALVAIFDEATDTLTVIIVMINLLVRPCISPSRPCVNHR